jgi:hypothetical protein
MGRRYGTHYAASTFTELSICHQPVPASVSPRQFSSTAYSSLWFLMYSMSGLCNRNLFLPARVLGLCVHTDFHPCFSRHAAQLSLDLSKYTITYNWNPHPCLLKNVALVMDLFSLKPIFPTERKMSSADCIFFRRQYKPCNSERFYSGIKALAWKIRMTSMGLPILRDRNGLKEI